MHATVDYYLCVIQVKHFENGKTHEIRLEYLLAPYRLKNKIKCALTNDYAHKSTVGFRVHWCKGLVYKCATVPVRSSVIELIPIQM